MIGFLSGRVRALRGRQAIILAGGVGYAVSVPPSHVPSIGGNADLFVHTHVREGTLALYGFKDEASLDLFERLLSVSGVGPRSALAIISAAGAETIKKAIEATNLNFFTSVPGIGKKSAQKIIIELKPKFGQSSADLGNLDGNSELVQALTQLGFSKNEIGSVVSQIDARTDLSGQIKHALKLLR